MTKTLLQRIATAISTAPQGETYEDCRNNEAKAALEEIADWLEEEKLLFIAPTGLRNHAKQMNTPKIAKEAEEEEEYEYFHISYRKDAPF